MIYGIQFQRKKADGTFQDSERVLVSGLNEANALDILSKYCEKGIGKITYFRMIADGAPSDGNVLLITTNDLNTYFT